MKFRLTLAGLLVAAPIAAQAQEQLPLDLSDTTIGVTLAGHDVTLPRPDWFNGDNGADQYYEKVGDQAALLELIPGNEDFEDWHHMIAVLAVADPDYGVEQHEASIAAAFSQNCAETDLVLQKLAPLAEGYPEMLLAMCGAYEQETKVTKTGSGEILIAVVLTSPAGSAKLYQEWQGPAFDVNDATTWPVSEDELLSASEHLQQLAAFEPNPEN